MEVSTEVWQERARVLLEKSKVMSHFVIDSSGVWNASERGTGFDDFPVDCEIERPDAAWTFALDEWKPALAIPELADKDAPSLPFPFTAPELAAFMLYGMGVLVVDFFGDWKDGPSIRSLNELPAGQSELRALVKGAYSAYRLAQERVGNRDDAALTRSEAAHKAYWNSHNDQTLLKAFEDARAEWNAAHGKWLTAMVKTLLETKAQAAPEPTQAAPATRVTAGNAQDEIILQAIRSAGYDPLRLPKNPPGKPGVKAQIRMGVVGRTLFPRVGTQFTKAWERLRARGEISDA